VHWLNLFAKLSVTERTAVCHSSTIIRRRLVAKRQRQGALLVRCDERTELNNSRVQRRTNELISRRPSTSFAVSLFSPILSTTGSLPYRGTAGVGGWKFMTETFCSTRRGQSARCIVGRALNARNMAATCSQDISYRARTQRRFFSLLCTAEAATPSIFSATASTKGRGHTPSV